MLQLRPRPRSYIFHLLMFAGFVMAWASTAAATAAPTVHVVRAELQQGGFWLAKVPPSSHVTVGSRVVPVIGGYVLVGLERKSPPKVWVKVCTAPASSTCTVTTLQVAPRTYAVQNVKNIARQHVTPNPVEQKTMAADNAAIGAARRQAAAASSVPAHISPTMAFAGPWRRPAPGPVTGVYGSARAYNGQERTWHKGVDYANPTGTKVVAPAAGIVRLARATFMSGNLIMLDHGAGLTTVYAHLHSMAVTPGQRVAAGDVLGQVGTTGRSSGPHLHWGMYWYEVAIDPAPWL
jgi:murein DD-endopeptidase MepM/ murein hydrolase activator NlpD